MLSLYYHTNKNKNMINSLKRKTYNYYRKADVKKIAAQTKQERLLRLSHFN